jgi:MFS transporter, DHA3 family, macrolide efflux protein
VTAAFVTNIITRSRSGVCPHGLADHTFAGFGHASISLFNRDFILVWQGQMVSQMGSQMFSLALLYWILETTGSATIMGLVLMSAALPGAILGPFGGTLADNVSRKWLMVYADGVRGVAALSFVFALWYGDPRWSLPLLIVCQIIFGICAAIFRPALSASVPEIVPRDRLASANSLLQGTTAATSTLSMGLGGYLYALLGGPAIFLINGVSFVISAVASCFVRIPQKRPREPMTRANALQKFRADTVEGMSFVWERRGLRTLIIVSELLNFVLVPTGLALPILVRDYLGRGPEFLGLMGACQSAGAIGGFALAGLLKTPPGKRPFVVAGGIGAIGVVVIAIGLNRSPELSLVLLALFGALVPLVNVNIMTVIQGTTPSAVRGRVMGILGTLVLGLMPIAQGLSGFLIDALDKRVVAIYSGVGLAMVLFIGLAWFTRAYREFLATPID